MFLLRSGVTIFLVIEMKKSWKTDNMMTIAELTRKARAMGLSYGQFVALGQPNPPFRDPSPRSGAFRSASGRGN